MFKLHIILIYSLPSLQFQFLFWELLILYSLHWEAAQFQMAVIALSGHQGNLLYGHEWESIHSLLQEHT